MKCIYKIFILVLFSLCATDLLAQVEPDSTESTYSTKKPYHVVLKDGSSYTGFILKDDAREVLVRTTNVGEIYIPKVNIKSITEIDDIGKLNQGKYFGDEIYYTRYLFSPSALSLRKGEGNAYMPYGLYAQTQFGVTNNFDVGIGSSWLGNPLTLTLKYTLQLKENLHLGVGGIGITSTYGLGGYFGGGAGYGVLTSGKPSSNISVGGGYGALYVNGFTGTGYLISVGGYKRFRSQLAVLFDGVYLPQLQIYVGGPGIRYFRKRREGDMVDFGILLIGSDAINGGLPFTGFPIISYIATL